MKTFKGNRGLDEIIKLAEEKGYNVNKTDFNKGGDYIYLDNVSETINRIAFNTFNGGFMVYNAEHQVIARHTSSELDNEPWYEEILDLVYESNN